MKYSLKDPTNYSFRKIISERIINKLYLKFKVWIISQTKLILNLILIIKRVLFNFKALFHLKKIFFFPHKRPPWWCSRDVLFLWTRFVRQDLDGVNSGGFGSCFLFRVCWFNDFRCPTLYTSLYVSFA